MPPALEHLEAVERLSPVIMDTFVKYGQLTTADKEVLKKIKPLDYTLEARLVALERWKTELTRRSRGIHVQQTGSSSLLSGGSDDAHKSEDALFRRFDMLLHLLRKIIQAPLHQSVQIPSQPGWATPSGLISG